MADPITISCPSACTVTLDMQVSLIPFSMSVQDGALLSGLIVSVWVSALVFRYFIRMVRNPGEPD